MNEMTKHGYPRSGGARKTSPGPKRAPAAAFRSGQRNPRACGIVGFTIADILGGALKIKG